MPDYAHARRELDRFLGIDPDADDVSYDPPAPVARAPHGNERVGGDTSPPRADWFDDAACRTATPGLFFAFDEPTQDVARAICATCPARVQCRDYGREYRLHGMWGGETEVERAELGRGPRLTTGLAYTAGARARRKGLG